MNRKSDQRGRKPVKPTNPSPTPPTFSPPPPPTEYMDMMQANDIASKILSEASLEATIDQGSNNEEKIPAETTYETMSIVAQKIKAANLESTIMPKVPPKKKDLIQPKGPHLPSDSHPPPPCTGAGIYQKPKPLPPVNTFGKKIPEMNRVIVDIWELRKKVGHREYLRSAGEESLGDESEESEDSEAYLSEDSMSNLEFERQFTRAKPADTPRDLERLRSVTSLICFEEQALRDAARESWSSQDSVASTASEACSQNSKGSFGRSSKISVKKGFFGKKKKPEDESLPKTSPSHPNVYVDLKSQALQNDPRCRTLPVGAAPPTKKQLAEMEKKAKKEQKKIEKELRKEKHKKEKETKKHGKSNSEATPRASPTLSVNDSQSPPSQDYDLICNIVKEPTRETFMQYSVSELADCLTLCGMPNLAQFCQEERLDGNYLVNHVTPEILSEPPFSLSQFYITKLQNIIEGFRPKLEHQ